MIYDILNLVGIFYLNYIISAFIAQYALDHGYNKFLAIIVALVICITISKKLSKSF